LLLQVLLLLGEWVDRHFGRKAGSTAHSSAANQKWEPDLQPSWLPRSA
jgi:hypothetical protein